MLDIAGSLWSVPLEEQNDALFRAKAAGLETLHWDMTDGAFAPQGGFRADYAGSVSADWGMRSEAHLMTHSPVQEIDGWTEFCERVIIHRESATWRAAAKRIEARGSRAALAVEATTPLDRIPREIDVLCMSITPGSAGSELDPHVFRRVEVLKSRSPHREVGIDGGVQAHHVAAAHRVGASWLAVGTDLFTVGGTQRWARILAQREKH